MKKKKSHVNNSPYQGILFADLALIHRMTVKNLLISVYLKILGDKVFITDLRNIANSMLYIYWKKNKFVRGFFFFFSGST